MVARPPESFLGGRFEVTGSLGAGGMGIVYRARDRLRGADVAIKALRVRDAAKLQALKHEFRSRADIVHPNLVTLHELIADDGQWLLTMELIDGVHFLEWVRPHADTLERLSDADPSLTAHLDTFHGDESPTLTVDGYTTSSKRKALVGSELVLERLGPALGQLVLGVQALHQVGKLHRDLKPGNVLVTADGRVVLCDFGLLTEAGRSRRDRLQGTPAYMSPEQAARGALTPASDLYSVGVMLYEALTGRVPFGDQDALEAKQKSTPRPPSAWKPDVVPELDALCTKLLERDPARRPSASETLAALGFEVPSSGSRSDEQPFVGRHAELAALRKAHGDARTASVSVIVRGLSGMGKSELVEHFLEELRADADALVMTSRCYQRESAPYKALDALVDVVTDTLVAMPPEAARKLLPPSIQAVTRVFPVISRACKHAGIHGYDAPADAQALRRDAFDALRVLVHRLALERPTTVFVDDAQWADEDSAAFFAALAHHEPSPPVLVLYTHRAEEETSALVHAVLHPPVGTHAGDVRELDIGPLAPDDARELVRRLRPETGAFARTDDIVAEAGGHPLFVSELAQAADNDRGVRTVDDFLARKIDALAAPARALLSVAALAARPLPLALLAHIAEVRDQAAALTVLTALRLARVQGAAETLSPAHDRIREVTVRRLGRDATRLHRALAAGLEASGGEHTEALIEHWLAAGEAKKAGDYARQAARRADDQLAFARAARYYEQALELTSPAGDERRQLYALLGQARDRAGQLGPAAEAYLTAAEGASREQKLDLMRLAVSQYLRAGRVEEGLAVGQDMLDMVGLRMPPSDLAAIRRILWSRLRDRIVRRRFVPVDDAAIDPELRQRLEVWWSVVSSVNIVDPIKGAALQLQYMDAALRSGSRFHAALGTSVELGFHSTPGPRASRRLAKLLPRARELVEASGEPYARGLLYLSQAAMEFLTTNWSEAERQGTEGASYVQQHCAGARYISDQCTIWSLNARVFRGTLGDLLRVVPEHLESAIERGDEYMSTALRAWRTNLVWLLRDDPDEARKQASVVVEFGGGRMRIYEYYALHTRATIDLYAGDASSAWQRLDAAWHAFTKSVPHRVHTARAEARFLRGRVALAAARATSNPELLDVTRQEVTRLERENTTWTSGLAALLTGCLENARGNADAATAAWQRAEPLFVEADMELHAHVARHRLGATEATEAWLRAEGVRHPARLVSLYAP